MRRTRTRAPAEPALLDRANAARYLGCSLSHFQEEVRRFLPTVDIASPSARKPMPRWRRADLDAFIASRQRMAAS
jgi:hypothetical protein